METTRILTCGSCGLAIDACTEFWPDLHQPCPSCGSRSRHAEINFIDSIEVHDQVRLKARHSSGGKPFLEVIAGDVVHRDSGKLSDLRREIDRQGDRYREKIVDPETGQIIHEVDEALSEHQGHGSAKLKRSRGRSDGKGEKK